MAKNEAKVEQHPEVEIFLIEKYFLSSSTASPKIIEHTIIKMRNKITVFVLMTLLFVFLISI